MTINFRIHSLIAKVTTNSSTYTLRTDPATVVCVELAKERWGVALGDLSRLMLLVALLWCSSAQMVHAQFSGGGGNKGGTFGSESAGAAALVVPPPTLSGDLLGTSAKAKKDPVELLSPPAKKTQPFNIPPKKMVTDLEKGANPLLLSRATQRVLSAKSFSETVEASIQAGIIEEQFKGLHPSRFSRENQIKIQQSLVEIAKYEVRSELRRDTIDVRNLRAVITSRILAEALERNVIDPNLLGPDRDWLFGPNPDVSRIEEIRRRISENQLIGLLGNPAKGRGCLNCIPNPGMPEPGGGFLGGTLPSEVDKKPIPILHAQAGGLVESNRRPERVDPIGFTDVVRITNKASDRDCTGVLVAADKVVTAAHCVAMPPRYSIGDKRAAMKIQVPRQSFEAFTFCQAENLKLKLYRYPCVRFDDATILDVVAHPDYQAETVTTKARNDIAIITIQLPQNGAIRRQSEIDLLTTSPSAVTIAGYGMNLLRDRNPLVIEVGWNGGAIRRSEGEDFYFDPNDVTLTGACYGDSGGAVFRDRVYGKRDERHRLVAIISSGRTDALCSGGFWITTTWLSDAKIQSFLRKYL